MKRAIFRRLGLVCASTSFLSILSIGGLALLGRLDPAPMPVAGSWGTRILAIDGTVIALAPAPGGVWQFQTSAGNASLFLRQLLVVVEDRHFGMEPGVDPRAVLRAGLQWIVAGHVVSGGSTLTMQVAKLLDPRPRRLFSKVLETARAIDMWRRLTPDQIMGLWLSLAPFGGNLVGIDAASYAYFGKPPGALNASEAALLIALPRRPEALRPDRHPDAARRLRNRILKLAGERGLLSQDDVAAAQEEPLPHLRRPMPQALPQILASVRHPPLLQTSLDPVIQTAVDQIAQASMTNLPPHVALTVMVADLKSRQISALWLGRWDDAARAGRMDLTRRLRSPGSTLKPFLYALAFADGLAHPDTLLADAPDRFGAYGPEDFSGRFSGRVTATEALRRSLNMPAVGLLANYGALRFDAALKAAGTPLALPRNAVPSLPIILGGAGLSMRELMALYAGLATDGKVQRLRLSQTDAPSQQLLSPASAQTVSDILTRPFPGDAAAHGIAWKTGTSWGDRDNWAFGFDRNHLIGVWVGRPDGSAMDTGQAADHALPILANLFSAVPAAPRIIAPHGAMLSLVSTVPSPDPLRLLFPSAGAVIQGLGPLDLKAIGGLRPLSFLVDNTPITSVGALRQTQWVPPSPGFYHITILDAAGSAVHATIRITDD